MSPIIKYFITADNAVIDQISRKLSVHGFFDNFSIVLFPAMSPKFFIVLGTFGSEGKLNLLIRVKQPSGGGVVAEMEIQTVANSVNETVNSLIEVPNLPLPEQGLYTMEVIDTDCNEVINTYHLTANFPLERILDQEETAKILNDPLLAKSSMITIGCPNCNKTYTFQLNLDPDKIIESDSIQFPENDILECCGKKVDLTGVRRQISWEFGQKLQPIPPKA